LNRHYIILIHIVKILIAILYCLDDDMQEKKKIRARRGKAIVSKRKRNKTLISSRPTRKTRRRSSSQATITKKGKQPRTLISSRTTTRGPPKKGSYHLNQHGDGGFDDRDNEETYQQLLPAQKGKGTHIIGGKGVPAALGPSIQPYHIDRHTGRIYYDYELIPIRQCVVFRSDVMVGGISTIGSTSDRGGAVAKGAVAKGAVLTHPPYSPRSVSHDSFYDDLSLGDEQETRTEYDGRGGGGW
jgi:hypothetical protein